MSRYVLPLLVAAGLVVFLALGLNRDPQKIPSPLVGKPAPGFVLPALADPQRTVSPQNYSGNFYALNVWGSWCVACRDEHEVLMRIAREGQIPLIGLNWKDTRESAQRWLVTLGNPYVVTAFDEVGDAAIDWGVYGAPETFLVNTQGQIVHKHIGPLSYAIWRDDFLARMSQ